MATVTDQFGIREALSQLGIKDINEGTSTGSTNFANGKVIESYSPVDGTLIAKVTSSTKEDYETAMAKAAEAFKTWRLVPAPKRGEIVRQMGDELRKFKDPLGKLVSYEMGKSLQEGLGEVQEMIDICDFAVGLSRQLYGLTMHSERPMHRMYEQWHPFGTVGIISAFNFPVAVWSWNSMLAWVCGDVCIWKPSSKTPLCAVACQNIIRTVLERNDVPEGVSCLVVGNESGDLINNDKRIPLVSFTGSTRIGRHVSKTVAERFGNTILELGGNNAIIVSEHADISMVLVGAVFGAVGTAGQRCTSTRRLIVHDSIYDKTVEVLKNAYGQLKIGNPLDSNNHVGPLIDKGSVQDYLNAIEKAKQEGGKVLVEGGVMEGEGYESGCYVKPCIIEAENHFDIVQEETFAPILYVMKYTNIEEAIALQNGVPQGLSSSIF
ncbi:MAG: aldehyde dehydrogenase family protein, partial [Flavobacterium sp.]